MHPTGRWGDRRDKRSAHPGEHMTDTPVTYEVKDGVGWVPLNRPAVLNALTTELAERLAAHAEAAAADSQVKLVVVRGAGRAFCSGMDRSALSAGPIGETFFRHWIRALNCLEDMPKLSVAVLHGHAIGGGLQLSLACDLRIALQAEPHTYEKPRKCAIMVKAKEILGNNRSQMVEVEVR